MKIVLREPVILGPGATPITEIDLRERITGKDLRAMRVMTFDLEHMMVGDLLALAERLAKQPAAVFDAMSDGDIAEVVNAVMGFFAKSRGTG